MDGIYIVLVLVAALSKAEGCDRWCKDFFRHCDDLATGEWEFPGDEAGLAAKVTFMNCSDHYIYVRCPMLCGGCEKCTFTQEVDFEGVVDALDQILDDCQDEIEAAATSSGLSEDCDIKRCPWSEDWMLHRGMCYKLSEDQQTYDGANASCGAATPAGYLAPVLDQEQYDFMIRELVDTAPVQLYVLLGPKQNLGGQWLNHDGTELNTVMWGTPTGSPPLIPLEECMVVDGWIYGMLPVPNVCTDALHYICATPGL